MNVFCSYCYTIATEGVNLLVCSKCQHRKYCGRNCQVADWKCGHKHWCGKAGEIGYDYDIRESEGKGLGVFALRHFEPGDKVMAERGFAHSKLRAAPHSVLFALYNLAPNEVTDLRVKFKVNAISTGDDDATSEPQVFVSMSRVNHHCTGNTEHYFIDEHKVQILTALRKIEPGEEITFSYVSFATSSEPYESMHRVWGFHCKCSSCSNPLIRSKLLSMKRLDSKLLQCKHNVEEACAVGEQLLRIYSELHLSNCLVHRTYYDLFQIAISRDDALEKARYYIEQALKHVVLMLGDTDVPLMQQFRQLALDPTTHRHYGAAHDRVG